MKLAVEIQKTSLEWRNVSDLLGYLGFSLVEVSECHAFYTPKFDVSSKDDVWKQACRVRDAFTGSSGVDPGFSLGCVFDLSGEKTTRHHFLEVASTVMTITSQNVTVEVSPSTALSDEEKKEWEKKRKETAYQNRLAAQRQRLVPAFADEKAEKVMELLSEHEHSGESLYKAYEMMEGNPSHRDAFHQQFGISKLDFKRFGDAVHNPRVSGDFARHAYDKKPKTSNPMTVGEAKKFVLDLSKKWLSSIS